MRHSILFIALLCFLMTGCDSRSEEGKVCAIDSDCAAELWCNVTSKTCAPVDCEGSTCDMPDGVGESSISSSNDELKELQDEVAQLQEEVEELQAGGGTGTGETACDPYGDPERWVWNLTNFKLGTAGIPGEGFDLDNSTDTCAPITGAGFPDCEGGIDNGIAGLAKLVNPLLEQALPSVSIVYSPLCGMLLFPETDPAESSFSPLSLSTKHHTTNIVMDSTSLEAQSTGSWVILIPLPFGEGSILRVVMTDVKLVSTLQEDGTLMTALAGGWVSEAALTDALSGFTADDLDGTPPDTALGIVMQLADRDTDGDGNMDSLSLGLRIEAVLEPTSEVE